MAAGQLDAVFSHSGKSRSMTLATIFLVPQGIGGRKVCSAKGLRPCREKGEQKFSERYLQIGMKRGSERDGRKE
ncbi:hypothetical protein HMPREF3038_01908 [Akkermansia sp. KLE1797]|jgi:hypothetical protein|nr:hypothetical protein HMPREF3038_01908 [Akkermansia sp. KLE1797]KXU54633.1 hypothetical protein HMPREF3039_01104 [Akkermansia sp. KLE1798]KZA05978.1 hypothetical protein HMPREF1326_00240 [Akkermansia sp. KLE1605]